MPAARAETPGATAGRKQKRPGGRTECNRQKVAAAVLIAFGMCDFLDDPVEMAMNRLLVASDNEDFREQMSRRWAPVTEALHLPLVAARAAGEISPHIEPATLIWMLSSPIIVSTVLMRVTPGDAFLDQLIEQTILACGGARIEGGISGSASTSSAPTASSCWTRGSPSATPAAAGSWR